MSRQEVTTNFPTIERQALSQSRRPRSNVRAAALGVTCHGSAPILDLCRKLVAAGHDPETPLEAYRGATLALITTSIGAAARLQINAHGTGFRPRSEADTGSPAAKSGPAPTEQWART